MVRKKTDQDVTERDVTRCDGVEARRTEMNCTGLDRSRRERTAEGSMRGGRTELEGD